jgi:Fur family transcriptional regulator, ferric uptake regulator
MTRSGLGGQAFRARRRAVRRENSGAATRLWTEYTPVVPARAKSRRTKTTPTTRRDLQALLRASGLRSTGPRIAVLSYLHDSAGPNSHAELCKALAGEGFDRATIYRNLVDLAEVGIVSRTDLGDHVWRFELKKGVAGAAHTDDHPHFVCIDCGEVSCLPGVSFRVHVASGAPRAVGKNKVAVQLKGLCDDCS